MKKAHYLSRRTFLRLSALGASSGALAACAPKVVKETVVVEKEVEKEVTQVVKEEVEVEKEVTRVVEKEALEEEMTIRWGRHINANEQPVYEYTEELWAKTYPNITLKVEEVPWADYWQKLLTQSAAGAAPDVFWTGGMYLPQFWSKGLVKNISPFIDADDDLNPEDFFEKWMKYLRFEDKYYYLPVRGSTFSLYYNKDLFDETGVDYPTDEWTYEEEFLDAAKELTIGEGLSKQYGCYFNAMGLGTWYNIFPTFDATIVSSDNCRCTLDEPNAIHAYQFLADLALKHGVDMKPGDTETPAPELFMTGRIAMFMTGSTHRGMFEEIEDFEWDVAMTPVGPNGSRGTPGWYGGTAMACETELPDQAWRFLKFQHSFETQVAYSRLHAYFPILIEAANDPSWMVPPPEHPEVWLRMTEYAAPDPFTPKWEEVRHILTRDLPLILDGSETAADLFPRLCNEIDPILAEGCEEWENATPCG